MCRLVLSSPLECSVIHAMKRMRQLTAAPALFAAAVARASAIHKTQRPSGRKEQLGGRSRHQSSRKPVADKKE